jgi:hypothetical protein
MMVEIGSYEMDGVMLDMGSKVKILSNKSWDLTGKLKLV